MTIAFRIAAGTVPGTKRMDPDGEFYTTNNQDAFVGMPIWEKIQDGLVVVVADGCSGSKHSDVGAKFLTRVLARVVIDEFRLVNISADQLDFRFWQRVQETLLYAIQDQAKELAAPGEDLNRVIARYFLCGLIGAIVTKTHTVVFGCGDLLYGLNGEFTQIGATVKGAPPYLAYNLIPSEFSATPDLYQLKAFKVFASRQGTQLLLGSDGMKEYFAVIGQRIQGSRIQVPSIPQLFADSRTFKSSSYISRILIAMNTPLTTVAESGFELNFIPGVLSDDTTMLLVDSSVVGADLLS